MEQTKPLRDFVVEVTRLVESGPRSDLLVRNVAELMRGGLLSTSSWLSAEFRRVSPDRYSQYLLYCDPLERFSIVSFVWGPKQRTPIHNHTVWGVIGQLEGAEQSQRYRLRPGLPPEPVGETETLLKGQVTSVMPPDDDVHEVRNESESDAAISIHVYGGNIGRISRSIVDKQTGEMSAFVSSYMNTVLPNIWS